MASQRDEEIFRKDKFIVRVYPEFVNEHPVITQEQNDLIKSKYKGIGACKVVCNHNPKQGWADFYEATEKVLEDVEKKRKELIQEQCDSMSGLKIGQKPPRGHQLVSLYNEKNGKHAEVLVKVPPRGDDEGIKRMNEEIRKAEKSIGLVSDSDDDDDDGKPSASGQGSSGPVDEDREMTKSEKKRAKRARNRAAKSARKADEKEDKEAKRVQTYALNS